MSPGDMGANRGPYYSYGSVTAMIGILLDAPAALKGVDVL